VTNKRDEKDEENDLRGFQEFLDVQKENTTFLPRGISGSVRKQTINFNNISFLSNDRSRLMRMKTFFSERINFIARYDQSDKLINDQASELKELKQAIFEISDEADSSYRKSLREVFDGFFKKPN
jgi:hypothetical protein